MLSSQTKQRKFAMSEKIGTDKRKNTGKHERNRQFANKTVQNRVLDKKGAKNNTQANSTPAAKAESSNSSRTIRTADQRKNEGNALRNTKPRGRGGSSATWHKLPPFYKVDYSRVRIVQLTISNALYSETKLVYWMYWSYTVHYALSISSYTSVK